jgi:hypothetical protein
MRTLLAAVGVCLLVCTNLSAQGNPPATSADTAGKEARSDATVAASPAPAATVMRLQPAPSGFASGPSGDLWMDGRSPFPTYGIQLVAHAPDTPSIVAKQGTADSSSWFDVDDVNNKVLVRMRGDGAVGIGTTSPESIQSYGPVLHLSGAGPSLRIKDTSSNGDWNLLARTGASINLFRIYDNNQNLDRLTIDATGNVGIGTTPPVTIQSFGPALHLRGGGPSLRIQDDASGGDWNLFARTGSATNLFRIYDNVAHTDRLTIDASGIVNVVTALTVGSGSSGTKLTVNGDVTVTGNLSAKFQDIAEWVPVTQPVSAGTVVVVSNDASNTVSPSLHAYDTRVAGVISAQPGLTLGEGSATEAKVATTGRVKVRVDATTHPIARGDLLVTSNKPGTAMFSEALDLGGVKIHRPGTLIGKALEPLAKGQGEILVLLSLQ